MRFYRLLPEEGDGTDEIVCRAIENYETKYELDMYVMNEGRTFENWCNDFTFEFDPDEGHRPIDFMINNLGWVIVSQRVHQIFDSLGVTNVEFLPVVIKDIKSGTMLDGYSVLNVIELTDALNWEQSRVHEYKSRGASVVVVSKFVLKKQAVIGKYVLRLKGQPDGVFFSDVVVKALKRNSVTGCSFNEVKLV